MFEGLAKDSIDKQAAERSALRCWATFISIKNYDDFFFPFSFLLIRIWLKNLNEFKNNCFEDRRHGAILTIKLA